MGFMVFPDIMRNATRKNGKHNIAHNLSSVQARTVHTHANSTNNQIGVHNRHVVWHPPVIRGRGHHTSARKQKGVQMG